MSSKSVRFQEILNQAFAENFTCLTQKLVNPLKNLFLDFLIGIPFFAIFRFYTTEPHLMSTFAFLWKCRFKQCSSFSTLHLVLNHFYLVSIKWGNQFLMQHLCLRWFQRSSTFLAKLFHCRTFAIKFLLGKVMPFFDSFHLTNVRTKGDEMFPLHVGLKTYFKVST